MQSTVFQKRTLWVLWATFTSIALVWALIQIQEIVFLVFLAYVLTSALTPVANQLEKALPRLASTLVILLAFLGISGLVLLPTIVVAISQLQRLIEQLPQYIVRSQTLWGQISAWQAAWAKQYPSLKSLSLGDGLPANLGAQVFSGVTGVTATVSHGALDLFTLLILTFFMLYDRSHIQAYLLRFFPVDNRTAMAALFGRLSLGVGAFVRGQLMVMLLTGLLTTVGLMLIGLPYPLLFGLLTGVLTAIPIIGPNLALILAIGVAFFTPGTWVTALWVVGIYMLVQTLENNLIVPWVMSRAVGLHPLAITIGVFAGGLTLGLPGILLSVPLLTCGKILLEEWLNRQHPAVKPEGVTG
jgi:predicted PurR-regulated permease PerM